MILFLGTSYRTKAYRRKSNFNIVQLNTNFDISIEEFDTCSALSNEKKCVTFDSGISRQSDAGSGIRICRASNSKDRCTQILLPLQKQLKENCASKGQN